MASTWLIHFLIATPLSVLAGLACGYCSKKAGAGILAHLIIGLVAGLMLMAGTTALFVNEQSQAAGVRILSEGPITALIFREGYYYEIDGEQKRREPGWYLHYGPVTPSSPDTSTETFLPVGEKARRIAIPETPGETMRLLIEGFGEAPIQVCTGACQGIAGIDDADMPGSPGIVAVDWRTVMSARIGRVGTYLTTAKDNPAAGRSPLDASLYGLMAAAMIIGCALASLFFSMAHRALWPGSPSRIIMVKPKPDMSSAR